MLWYTGNVPLKVLKKCCYLLSSNKNLRWQHWPRQFRLSSPRQFHKSPELSEIVSRDGVTYGTILNARWLPWHLIGCNIFNLFSRVTEWLVTRLARNILLKSIVTFWRYFKFKMATLAFDWLAIYNFLSLNIVCLITSIARNVSLWFLKNFPFGESLNPRWLSWTQICLSE